MVDPGGALWLDNTNGMTRLDQGRFTDFTKDDLKNATPALYRACSDPETRQRGSPQNMVMGPDGCVWYLPAGEPGIGRFDARNVKPAITNFAGLPANTISCIAQAPDGSIWVGTSAGGVARFAGQPAAETLVATNGLLANRVFTIYCDPRGSVWVGVSGGIVRYDGNRWTEFTQTNGAPGLEIAAIAGGPDGTVWFGAADGGLSRFDGKTLAPVPRGSENLAPSLVQTIFPGADGSLWFVTLRGITHYDGIAWSSLDEGDGLLPPLQYAIAQDQAGAIWVGGDSGLTRYQPAAVALPAPKLVVQTDRAYHNLNELPKVTAGRLVTFKCDAADYLTRPEKRQYRFAVVPGKGGTPPARHDPLWQPPSTQAQFAWPFNSRGRVHCVRPGD